MNARGRGVLAAFVGTLLWSTTGVYTSYLLTRYTLQPLTLAFWRDIFASLALIAVLLLRRPGLLKIGLRDVPFFAIYGSAGLALMNALWTYSVQFNGAAVATVLAYSAPAFTVLLAWPLLQEPWTLRKLLAVGLSLAGCVLVAQAYRAEVWQVNLAGIVTGVGTGVLYSLFSLAGRWSGRRFPSPWTVTAYGFLFAAAALGLTQTPASLFSLGRAWDGWAILAALGLGPSLLGIGLYMVSLRHLPAGVASLIVSLEPALAAGLAFLVLAERLAGPQWLGMGLILAAVVLVQAEAAQPQAGLSPSPAAPVGAVEAVE